MQGIDTVLKGWDSWVLPTLMALVDQEGKTNLGAAEAAVHRAEEGKPQRGKRLR